MQSTVSPSARKVAGRASARTSKPAPAADRRTAPPASAPASQPDTEALHRDRLGKWAELLEAVERVWDRVADAKAGGVLDADTARAVQQGLDEALEDLLQGRPTRDRA